MKKCPACDKTFEDSMRFCQVDGTPLVDDVPFDPFATIVGVTAPVPEPEVEKSEPFVPQPEEAGAIAEPEDLLDLQDSDPLKTMYASDDEMKAALRPDDITPEPGIFEVPPVEETSPAESAWPAPESAVPDSTPPPSVPEPELPSFNVPDVPAPSFGDISPPPSPFSSGDSTETPMKAPSLDEPLESRSFNEAETIIQGGFTNPFENPEQTPVEERAPSPSPVEEWTPSPAPEANWENQQIGSNTPFQPPVAGGATGQNKTLPIVSLVLGILSLCCYVSPVTGLAALVTGFIGMKNANTSPDVYGGKGLAIAGMVLGGLLLVLGLAYWIFLLFFGGMAMIMDAAR